MSTLFKIIVDARALMLNRSRVTIASRRCAARCHRPTTSKPIAAPKSGYRARRMWATADDAQSRSGYDYQLDNSTSSKGNRMARCMKRYALALVVTLGIVGCGGGSSSSQSTAPSHEQSAAPNLLAPVLSACEQSGGSSLMPGSGGQDTSSLPDATPAVCGCWTGWMQTNLSPADQTSVADSVAQTGSFPLSLVTDVSVLRELTSSLISCDTGQTPANSPPSSSSSTITTDSQGGSSSSASTRPPAPQTPSPSATAPAFGPACGTVTGGKYDYQGQTLTVHAATGVSCTTAMTVIGDLSAGKAQNHQGQDQLSSYFSLDGWTCPYNNMGTQSCSKGKLIIQADAPGAQP
jgi:hypothetical protein